MPAQVESDCPIRVILTVWRRVESFKIATVPWQRQPSIRVLKMPYAPPAGWYPDPNGSGPGRYWDGQAWTYQQWRGDQLGAVRPGPFPPPRSRNAQLFHDNGRWIVGLLVVFVALLGIAFALNGKDEGKFLAPGPRLTRPSQPPPRSPPARSPPRPAKSREKHK